MSYGIDFTEIPPANGKGDEQDAFELFGRDFLKEMGFKIIKEPGRGPDGGKDMVVEETRIGNVGNTKVKWLVSCKHNANGGKAVSFNDEPSILERVGANNCNGFMGFYSTNTSQPLRDRLDSLKENKGIEVFIYDQNKIGKEIVGNSNCSEMFKNLFPKSYNKATGSTEPIKLLKFYIDKKYSSEKNIFYTYFTPFANFIELLREGKDIRQILKTFNVEYHISKKLSANSKVFDNVMHKDFEDAVNLEIAKEEMGINIKSKMFQWTSILIDGSFDTYVAFKNYLLVSPYHDKKFKDILDDLKNMLK